MVYSPKTHSTSSSNLGHPIQGGFTLLEILITLLIISIGMLGFAALQVKGLQSNHGAMLNSQAAFLAYDVSERIRANVEAKNTYTIAADASPKVRECSSKQCNPTSMAEADIYEWRELCRALLPNGKGAISWAGQTGTISISWAEPENLRTFSLVIDL